MRSVVLRYDWFTSVLVVLPALGVSLSHLKSRARALSGCALLDYFPPFNSSVGCEKRRFKFQAKFTKPVLSAVIKSKLRPGNRLVFLNLSRLLAILP